MACVARLKAVLMAYFDPARVRTVALRLVESGAIPAGRRSAGRKSSAAISTADAALVLLAMAAYCEPIDAPAEAQRIGAFRLLCHDHQQRGETIRTPWTGRPVALLDALVDELERCDLDHDPSGWNVSATVACQISPDRRVFGDSAAGLLDLGDGDCVVRRCTIPARLLADIAALFAATAAAVAAVEPDKAA